MWDCSVLIYPRNKCPPKRKEDIALFIQDFQAQLKDLSTNSQPNSILTLLSFTDTFLKYPLSGLSSVLVFVE